MPEGSTPVDTRRPPSHIRRSGERGILHEAGWNLQGRTFVIGRSPRADSRYNASVLRKTLPMLVLAVLTLAVVGCQKPLFDEDVARSPYERYLALRGLDRPVYEMNAYGRQQPALRQRLRPLEQP